ncbi:MAG: AAA family ATPase [Armatimonadetes bacterium]|nr:AAA family ATPase [Armatimonadota bacterium]
MTAPDPLLAKRPWIILLWGAPAGGKTTLARLLLERCRTLVVCHLSPDGLNRSALGDRFVSSVRVGLYEGVLTLGEHFLASGASLLLDGTFLQPDLRRRVTELAARTRTPLISVLVHCPLAARLARNRNRTGFERVPEPWLRDAHCRAGAQAGEAGLVVDTARIAAEVGAEDIVAGLVHRIRRQTGLVRTGGQGVPWSNGVPSPCRLITRAGTPTAVTRSGISLTTAAPPPTRVQLPMRTPWITLEPIPSQTPSPMRTLPPILAPGHTRVKEPTSL